MSGDPQGAGGENTTSPRSTTPSWCMPAARSQRPTSAVVAAMKSSSTVREVGVGVAERHQVLLELRNVGAVVHHLVEAAPRRALAEQQPHRGAVKLVEDLAPVDHVTLLGECGHRARLLADHRRGPA